MTAAEAIDPRRCMLGEGPIWHPDRRELLWFDILEGKLMAAGGAEPREWSLGEMASAAALTTEPERILVATETALVLLHLGTGGRETVAALEADRPETRSNDGRADPWGGFWIGTMGKSAERGRGAVRRWRDGELRTVVEGIDIPNAICFDADRGVAYWTDTPTQVVRRQPVHPETGWPEGEAVPHVDLRGTEHHPDGAVVDAEGALWIAEWGSARVARHDSDGRFVDAVRVPGLHSSCPAFGGPDLTTLYCTTARQGLSAERDEDEAQGRTYAVPGAGRGRPEPRIAL